MARFTEIYMIMELCDSDLKKLCRQSKFCNFSSPVLRLTVSRFLVTIDRCYDFAGLLCSDVFCYGV